MALLSSSKIGISHKLVIQLNDSKNVALSGDLIGEGIAGERMAQLAGWFFGGSSGRSAEEILCPVLLTAAAVAVQKQLIVSDQNFHVHQVLSTHLSEEHSTRVVSRI